jgi:hypothetical protein
MSLLKECNFQTNLLDTYKFALVRLHRNPNWHWNQQILSLFAHQTQLSAVVTHFRNEMQPGMIAAQLQQRSLFISNQVNITAFPADSSIVAQTTAPSPTFHRDSQMIQWEYAAKF